MKRILRRENPIVRKEEILNAAIDLAVKIGYQSITRETVAKAACTSCALVTRYFNMAELKEAVMTAAIEKQIIPIIAQGLGLGDIQAQNITGDLKQKVIAYLSN